MCFESKKKKVAVTNEEATQQIGGTTGLGSTIPQETPQTVHNFNLAELVKQQTTSGKITWKRVKNSEFRYDRTYTASVGGFELTATADTVEFRDKNTLGSKVTRLAVSGILGTIERAVPVDPVEEFTEVLAAL